MFRLGGEYLNQQINHFQPQGGAFQTVRGTFAFSGQATMLQGATAPTGLAVQLLGAVPARDAVGHTAPARSTSSSTRTRSTRRPGRPTCRTPGRSRTPSPSRSGCAGSSIRGRTRPDGKGVSRFDPSDGYVYVGGYGDVPQDTYAERRQRASSCPEPGSSIASTTRRCSVRATAGRRIRRATSTSATRTPSSTSGPCPPASSTESTTPTSR